MLDDRLVQTATVRSLRNLTPSVREFELVPERGMRPWIPGSHLAVRVPVEGRHELRHYSLIGASGTSGRSAPTGTSRTSGSAAESTGGGAYRIAVKRMDPGRGGSRALWSLDVGATLEIGEPANHFEVSLQAPHHLLVAGGIGVTPMLGIAQALAARGGALRMCYAASSDDELAYRDDLAAVLGERLCTFVGRRIDLDAEIAALPSGAQMVVCGPLVMLDAARDAWARSGRPASDLRFETFGNTGRHAAQPFWVELADRSLRIDVPADRSLLDMLDDIGIAALSDCRRGECGLCAMRIVRADGTVDHRDVFLSARQKAADETFCACVSRVAGGGGIVLDSAYRPD